MKAARPFLVGQEHSRPPEAGDSLPRSRSPIKETRRGKATVIAPETAHCSHAYLDKALVIRGEATVTSPRQDPPSGGSGLSTNGPAAGGTHQAAGPSSQRKSRRPKTLMVGSYTRPDYHCPLGVGLYKPPGAPMQRVGHQ